MRGFLIEKCTSNQRNITWRDHISKVRHGSVLRRNIKRDSPATVRARPWRRRRRGRKRRSMGPELRLYTRCGEWSRREPSSCINTGECISGREEEASQHLASRRTHRKRTEKRRQRGHHVWCQRGKSWSFFLSSLAPVWCTRPCTHSRRARGRCIHTWYVRARRMRGNRHLLSSGNLAPGKLRRDDGFSHLKRVHGHAQRQNSAFWRRQNVRMKGTVHLFCSLQLGKSNKKTRKLTLARDKRYFVIC